MTLGKDKWAFRRLEEGCDGFVAMFVHVSSYPNVDLIGTSLCPNQEAPLKEGFMAVELFWKGLLVGRWRLGAQESSDNAFCSIFWFSNDFSSK